jgi:hypothetical protein
MTNKERQALAKAYLLGRDGCRRGIGNPYIGWSLPLLEAEWGRGYIAERETFDPGYSARRNVSF